MSVLPESSSTPPPLPRTRNGPPSPPLHRPISPCAHPSRKTTNALVARLAHKLGALCPELLDAELDPQTSTDVDFRATPESGHGAKREGCPPQYVCVGERAERLAREMLSGMPAPSASSTPSASTSTLPEPTTGTDTSVNAQTDTAAKTAEEDSARGAKVRAAHKSDKALLAVALAAIAAPLPGTQTPSSTSLRQSHNSRFEREKNPHAPSTSHNCDSESGLTICKTTSPSARKTPSESKRSKAWRAGWVGERILRGLGCGL